MAIVTNGRLEYEMSTIDVTYPDIGKVTYNGSYPLIVSNQWTPPVAPPKEIPTYDDCVTFVGDNHEDFRLYFEDVDYYGTIWYSTDHENWVDFSTTEQSADSKDGLLFVRGNCTAWAGRNITTLKATKKLECYGNIIAMTNYDNASNTVIFKYSTFASSLKDLVLTKAHIFENLRLLKEGADLPESCGIDFIFHNQKELTDIDEIPYFKSMSYISICGGCGKLKVKIGTGSKKIFSVPENLDGRDATELGPLALFRDTVYFEQMFADLDESKVPGTIYYLE